ncbi:dTDP-4-amino-4,6-dideoxy-D-glucose acyltransferase [compost metagenome]
MIWKTIESLVLTLTRGIKNNMRPKPNIRDYFLHGIYLNIYGLVKYFPSPIGDFLRYWVIKPFIKKMGKVRISEGVTIWYPYRVTLGDNVTLNNGVTIDGYGEVEIHDFVRVAHRATILSSDHIFSDPHTPIYQQGLSQNKTVIHKDCWLGCNTVVLPGVIIENGSIVGANAVVTASFSAYSIIGGIPGKKIGDRKSP